MPSNWMTGTLVTYLAELLSGTHKVMLLRSSYTPNPDDKFVSDLVAHECSVSGYVGGFGGAGRKTLVSKTLVEDSENNRVVFDAADPTPWSGLASGNTIRYIAVFEEVTSDALSPVVCVNDLQSDFVTNSNALTVQFNPLGIAYIQV